MKDYIKCCNCGFIGTVKTGEEVCPECKKKGCLAWVDELNPEVEDC